MFSTKWRRAEGAGAPFPVTDERKQPRCLGRVICDPSPLLSLSKVTGGRGGHLLLYTQYQSLSTFLYNTYLRKTGENKRCRFLTLLSVTSDKFLSSDL